MDAIVERALAKWPNVPHCYGWLALDARGQWRMRDEHAQQHQLPGERLTHTVLLGFIARNYARDEQGRWYFQNGPQRVYIDLELTPFVARSDPQFGFLLQTHQPLTDIQQAWLTDQGRLILQGQHEVVALLDDRDMAEFLPRIDSATGGLDEDGLLTWIQEKGQPEPLILHLDTGDIPIHFIYEASLEATFGFVRLPRADTTAD